MPTKNPIDATASEEQAIAEVVAESLALIQAIPLSKIEAAIRAGSAAKLWKLDKRDTAASREWRAHIVKLKEVEPSIDGVAQKGARFADLSMRRGDPRSHGETGGVDPGPAVPRLLNIGRKPILLDQEITELGANWARLHAGRLIRGIDARSRANVSRLVRNASRRLARNPRREVLEQLAREIQPYIGMTTGQAQAIQQWVTRARRSGTLTVAEISAERGIRVAAALNRRALTVAAREVAESFNEGTIRAARLAKKKARLATEPLKQAQTMEDGRQRGEHQQVSDSGPIPIEDVFPVFGADRPPWPGEHG